MKHIAGGRTHDSTVNGQYTHTWALPCCLFDLACFLLPFFLSLINTCMYMYLLEVTKQQTCMSVINKLVT